MSSRPSRPVIKRALKLWVPASRVFDPGVSKMAEWTGEGKKTNSNKSTFNSDKQYMYNESDHSEYVSEENNRLQNDLRIHNIPLKDATCARIVVIGLKLYTRVLNTVSFAQFRPYYTESYIARVNLTRARLISITYAHLERASSTSGLYVNLLRADDFFSFFLSFFFKSHSFAICEIDDFRTAVIELFSDRV